MSGYTFDTWRGITPEVAAEMGYTGKDAVNRATQMLKENGIAVEHFSGKQVNSKSSRVGT